MRVSVSGVVALRYGELVWFRVDTSCIQTYVCMHAQMDGIERIRCVEWQMDEW